ncbi:MAG: NAD(P)/FAD-dependent oxidoreductase [Peptococcaceae bacterium]|nr:NAD(P)/FAD-dependent oxidoreductase [Peptococcaceae bacterium]MDH7524634.1 NAD(P)/FAD-dependent oxidoreductase [Peptococcaceae bacterium]
MKTTEIVVAGGGPAGLSAAIEGARLGAKVLVIDENSRPGGQLFKQIHKFFGSREHQAGVRGLDIGQKLLEQTEALGIEVWLNSEAVGIDKDKKVWVIQNGKNSLEVRGERIILSTGAVENSLTFPGWTLPGVMGAGAAQTMINIHRVKPGKRILMIGSGNVGVIVSYQLMQAGAEVVAIIEAAPRLGGYGVHTAKVRRAGVPFYTSHTVKRALGKDKVEGAEIVALDDKWNPVPGTEKTLDVDTICVATGLTPLTELAWFLGCRFHYIPSLGGFVPDHNEFMETNIPGIYVAGDIAGVEEASTAMEEGRLAGIGAAASLGYLEPGALKEEAQKVWDRLNSLRSGPFGEGRRKAKEVILHREGEIVNAGAF